MVELFQETKIMITIKKSDTKYSHVFFHDFGERGVYNVSTDHIRYFPMNDPNFKNPAKLLAISGINAQLFVEIDGSSMVVKDMYYTDGSRFFTKEEIAKYCTGFKWKYE
jgi:hypothetical protein